jgi:hypothetical protein
MCTSRDEIRGNKGSRLGPLLLSSFLAEPCPPSSSTSPRGITDIIGSGSGATTALPLNLLKYLRAPLKAECPGEECGGSRGGPLWLFRRLLSWPWLTRTRGEYTVGLSMISSPRNEENEEYIHSMSEQSEEEVEKEGRPLYE